MIQFYDRTVNGRTQTWVHIPFEHEANLSSGAKPNAKSRPATDADKARYPEAWAAYEATKKPKRAPRKKAPKKKATA